MSGDRLWLLIFNMQPISFVGLHRANSRAWYKMSRKNQTKSQVLFIFLDGEKFTHQIVAENEV
jgi:hypothetical protein